MAKSAVTSDSENVSRQPIAADPGNNSGPVKAVPGWGVLLLAFFLIRLAFVPVGWFPCALAGLALLLWLNYRVRNNNQDKSSQRRSFYRRVWFGSFLFWLSMTVFMTYPHWATSIGWLAISFYLAFYAPAFLWLCHAGTRRGIPLWIAAPVFWTGLEWIQGHLFSGYLMGQLALTLYDVPCMIQLAEFGGSYAVSFLIVFVAALLAQSILPPALASVLPSAPHSALPLTTETSKSAKTAKAAKTIELTDTVETVETSKSAKFAKSVETAETAKTSEVAKAAKVAKAAVGREDAANPNAREKGVSTIIPVVSAAPLLAAVVLLLSVGIWGRLRIESLDSPVAASVQTQNDAPSDSAWARLKSYWIDCPSVPLKRRPPLRVALLQGNVPCQVYADPYLVRRSFAEYMPLSQNAVNISSKFSDKTNVTDLSSADSAPGLISSSETADSEFLAEATAAALGSPTGAGAESGAEFRTMSNASPAMADNPAKVDLLVWPESMYRYPLCVKTDRPLSVPPGVSATAQDVEQNLKDYQRQMLANLRSFPVYYRTAFLTGADHIVYDGDQEKRYNSALLVNSGGHMTDIYSKRHRVPFGEFIPFAEYIPFLQTITPVGQGTAVGRASVGMKIWAAAKQDPLIHSLSASPNLSIPAVSPDSSLSTSEKVESTPVLKAESDNSPTSASGPELASGPDSRSGFASESAGDSPWIVVPNICYENTLPHVIRRQLADVRAQNLEPDVLVNISNNGWFKGSFEVDLHLGCAVFRAVETRKPHLCASNGGLAAHISPSGRIINCGKKGHNNWFTGGVCAQVVLADVSPLSFRSFYSERGDLFALLCLAISGFVTIIEVLKPAQSKQTL